MKIPEKKENELLLGEGGGLRREKGYILYKCVICACGTENGGWARFCGDEGYFFPEKLYKDDPDQLWVFFLRFFARRAPSRAAYALAGHRERRRALEPAFFLAYEEDTAHGIRQI